jgi:hypothetical protein
VSCTFIRVKFSSFPVAKLLLEKTEFCSDSRRAKTRSGRYVLIPEQRKLQRNTEAGQKAFFQEQFLISEVIEL